MPTITEDRFELCFNKTLGWTGIIVFFLFYASLKFVKHLSAGKNKEEHCYINWYDVRCFTGIFVMEPSRACPNKIISRKLCCWLKILPLAKILINPIA